MEINLRGLLEKDIDSITLETLRTANPFKDFSPMNNFEDFLFGFTVGIMLGRMATTIQILYQRMPTDADNKELLDLIQRRTTEIRGKIKSAMSK
jgi:hypothetical protein